MYHILWKAHPVYSYFSFYYSLLTCTSSLNGYILCEAINTWWGRVTSVKFIAPYCSSQYLLVVLRERVKRFLQVNQTAVVEASLNWNAGRFKPYADLKVMKQPQIYLQSYKISYVKYIHDKTMPKLRLKRNLKY